MLFFFLRVFPAPRLRVTGLAEPHKAPKGRPVTRLCVGRVPDVHHFSRIVTKVVPTAISSSLFPVGRVGEFCVHTCARKHKKHAPVLCIYQRNERNVVFQDSVSVGPKHALTDFATASACWLYSPSSLSVQSNRRQNSSFSGGCRKKRAGSTALPGMRTTTEIL